MAENENNNENENGAEAATRFTLPAWVTNLAKSWKTILILIGALTFILGVSSQAISFGFDQVEKWQQIQKNTIDISNLKCLNSKKELTKSLKASKITLRSINVDYVVKGIEIPALLKDDYLALPTEIDELEKELTALPCTPKEKKK